VRESDGLQVSSTETRKHMQEDRVSIARPRTLTASLPTPSRLSPHRPSSVVSAHTMRTFSTRMYDCMFARRVQSTRLDSTAHLLLRMRMALWPAASRSARDRGANRAKHRGPTKNKPQEDTPSINTMAMLAEHRCAGLKLYCHGLLVRKCVESFSILKFVDGFAKGELR
jgi:hypothetical protein